VYVTMKIKVKVKSIKTQQLYWMLINDMFVGVWIPDNNARRPPYLLTRTLCLIYNL